jgi:hypothetical protein
MEEKARLQQIEKQKFGIRMEIMSRHGVFAGRD